MKPVLLALAIGYAVMGSALAGERCAVPLKDWQPRESLQRKLEGEGWKVRSIRSGDGCYQAHAIDADGQSVEVYFDPRTFDLVAKSD